jgi:hypothetical protein
MFTCSDYCYPSVLCHRENWVPFLTTCCTMSVGLVDKGRSAVDAMRLLLIIGMISPGQAENRLTACRMLLERFYTPASWFCSSPSTSSELLPERDVQPPEDVLTGSFVSRFLTQLGRRNTSMSVAIAEVYLDHLSKQLLHKHISESVGPNTPEMSLLLPGIGCTPHCGGATVSVFSSQRPTAIIDV